MSRARSVNYKDYSQFLLLSQINYTQTYYGEHSEQVSHDALNRYMREEALPPRIVWDHVRGDIVQCTDGCIAVDDTILDKNHSKEIELAYRQYSGNYKSVIKGIGVVTCIYINRETGQWWPIDYRIYDPKGDGKSKLEHVEEMLKNAIFAKKLSFRTVLMDSWYATTELMTSIHNLGKIFYCPLKSNRRIKTGFLYERVDSLHWLPEDLQQGRLARLKDMGKKINTKLFRIAVLTDRFDTIVTNDVSQGSAEAVKLLVGLRWKIEQLHRELKQLTGIEKCQCRRQRAQRNHIACAMIVLVCLKRLAVQCKTTAYRLKSELLGEYMRKQLKSPTIRFA
jgi:hypothetical protein